MRGKKRSLGFGLSGWKEEGAKRIIIIVIIILTAVLTFCAPTVCLTSLNPYDYSERQEVEVGDVVGF